MSEVKRPELLTASLGFSAMLHPSKGTLKLQMDDVSEATLTLEDKSTTIPMHAWVKMYNQAGFVGFFRRTSRYHNITSEIDYTLKHGIDILQDSIWDAETDFSGTVTEFLTALLNKQTSLINGVKPWALGTCSDTSTIKKKIDYDNLLDLFQSVATEKHDYYFTYDQTTWPWTVNFVAKPSSVASEFRLNRNIESCQINENDAELCTRLILSVNQMVNDATIKAKTDKDVKQNETVVRTYNNATAQASYGIIVKTADIDVTGDTFPNGPFPEADAWANDYLARRAAPLLQIDIDGQVLKGITGSDWDESKIGTKVRVALPDYSQSIEERCVTVTYPELFALPDKITVSLANSLPTFTQTMSSTQKTVAQNSRGGRGSARMAESFDQHFQVVDDSGNILRQAGMHLDADGLLVYADDNVNMVGSRFEVQANKIGMVVGYQDGVGNYIKAGEICLAINNSQESTATINANKIYLLGQTIADTITANYIDAKIQTLATLHARDITCNSLSCGVNIYGPNGLSLYTNGVWTITLTDNQDDTYTLSGTKLNGDSFTIGTFSRAASQTLSWSYGSMSISTSDPGSAAKTYAISSGYNYGRFGVTVNGETKYIKIHITH